MNYIISQSGRRWQGVRILALEEFPSGQASSVSLTEGVIRICSASRLQCELAALKQKDSDRLYLLLILRWSGVSRKELEQRIEQDSNILQRQFTASGITASFTENNAKGKELYLPLLQQFVGKDDCARQRSSLAFFPSETEAAINSPYLPGSWSIIKLDWHEIGSILSCYDSFMVSLQLIPTSLFPSEIKAIGNVFQFFNKQDTARNAPAIIRYKELLEMRKQSAYLVNIWISGNPDLAHEIRLYMQKTGLNALPLPVLLFSESAYLMSGIRILTNYMNRKGHRAEFSDSMLPPAFQRFTRLIKEDELGKCLGLSVQWDKIKGLNTHMPERPPVLIPEKMQADYDSVLIGQQAKTGRDVFLPVEDIAKHGFITGKPGSGKTTFALGFLYRLYRRKQPIPFLVIEPAKKEYRTLIKCIPELKVYTPGAAGVSPMQMNLFLPPPGVTLEEYLPCLDQIFDMSFSMTSLLKDIFIKVIRNCYSLYGWRDDSTRDSEGIQFFGLHEFIREFRRYIRDNVYDPESRNNVENSGILRLQKLLEQNYILFDTVQAPDYLQMLSEPTIIELDAISDSSQRSLVMAIIIVNLMALIRKREDFSGNIRNLILIDEAHVLLNPSGARQEAEATDPGSAALKMLQDMTLILRAYGTALIFSDQSPVKLTKEILGNVNMKMMFRLDDPEDRRILGQTALLDQRMLEEIVTLNPGQGFFSCSKVSTPLLLQTPDTEKELNLKKNLADSAVKERMQCDIPAPYAQCMHCRQCGGICDIEIRKEGRQLAQTVIRLSKRVRELLPADPSKAQETQASLPVYLKQEFPEEAQTIGKPRLPWTEQLAACTEIHMIRGLLIHGSCELNEEELTGKVPVNKSIPGENKRKIPSFSLMQYRS